MKLTDLRDARTHVPALSRSLSLVSCPKGLQLVRRGGRIHQSPSSCWCLADVIAAGGGGCQDSVGLSSVGHHQAMGVPPLPWSKPDWWRLIWPTQVLEPELVPLPCPIRTPGSWPGKAEALSQQLSCWRVEAAHTLRQALSLCLLERLLMWGLGPSG